MDYRLKSIYILLLYAEKEITSDELSLKLGVSTRTIKNDIFHLRGILREYGINISSMAGKGYIINNKNINDLKRIQELCFRDGEDDERYIQIEFGRQFYLTYLLILKQEYVKVEQLMDIVYVSRTTLTNDLKKVKIKLKPYHLSIESKSNYGIRIKGTELNKRLFISSYIYNESNKSSLVVDNPMIKGHQEKEDIRKILQVIRKKLIEYKISCSDYILQGLAIHLLIAIDRIKLSAFVEIDSESKVSLKKEKSFLAAKAIVNELSKLLNFTSTEDEIIYIAMHIESKKINFEFESNEDNKIQVDYMIDKIFQKVLEHYGISLFDQVELRFHLALHIPQLVIRSRYGMSMRNPLIFESIRRNIFAAKITKSACCVIQEYYSIEINADEYGYILLYFNIALRKMENRCNKDAVLINGRGRPDTIIIYNEIMNKFANEIRSLVIFETNDLLSIENDKFDFVITTVDLLINLDLPIVKIIDYTNLNNLRKELVALDCFPIQINRIIKEKNFVKNIKPKSKEYIIHFVAKHIINNGLVNFSVFDEKKMYAIEAGNGVLLIHDYSNACLNSFVFIGFLEKPMIWERKEVELIIFLETNKAERHKLPTLCRIFSLFIQNPNALRKVCKNKKLSELVQILSQQL